MKGILEINLLLLKIKCYLCMLFFLDWTGNRRESEIGTSEMGVKSIRKERRGKKVGE